MLKSLPRKVKMILFLNFFFWYADFSAKSSLILDTVAGNFKAQQTLMHSQTFGIHQK